MKKFVRIAVLFICVFLTLEQFGHAALKAEVKIAVISADHEIVLEQFTKNNPSIQSNKRDIYFLDSQERALMDEGIYLRLRLTNKSKILDSTVKIRDPSDEIYDEIKLIADCEWDVVSQSQVKACVVKNEYYFSEDLSKYNPDEIFGRFFSKHQKKFLKKILKKKERLKSVENLELFGPVASKTFKLPRATLELWKLKDGRTYLEFSNKVNPDEIDETKKQLNQLLKSLRGRDDPSAPSKSDFAIKSNIHSFSDRNIKIY